MLRKLVKPLGALVVSCVLLNEQGASAQTTGYVNPKAVPNAAPTLSFAEPGPAAGAFQKPAADCAPGVWFNMDYVIWWLKDAPSPGPLVTTGFPGVIGFPNTQTVFGDRSFSSGAFNGLRLEIGTWVDEQRTWGFEAAGFALEHRSQFAGIGSGANGAPFLARPFFNTQTVREEGILLAAPGFQSGFVGTASSTRMSGWDANLDLNVTDSSSFRADALVGIRCLYLTEHLGISQGITSLVNQGGLQNPLQAGESQGVLDYFGTASNFYGGQLGGRLAWMSDRWNANAAAKLALGCTDEVAILHGVSTARNAGALIQSGTLANFGNQGHYYNGSFAVVPELTLNVGYRLYQNITLRAGYSVLYWSDVVRPGSVVPHALSPAVIPNLQGFGIGAANEPRAQINSTDFWMQGLNLGIELRF